MTFTSVRAVQEKLHEIVDQIKTGKEEENKQKKISTRNRKANIVWRYCYTENFLCWKAKSDAELLEIKKKRMMSWLV